MPASTFSVFACAVCGAGTGDNAWAYTLMSVMLTVLPLGMIGGTVYWVSRRVKQADDLTKGTSNVSQHQDTGQFRSPRD